MNQSDHGKDESELGFFDRPATIKWILGVFYVLCALLVLAAFLVHRHIYVSWESFPAFYALYGFIACSVLVFLAKLMRVVLMRDEYYYDAKETSTNMLDKTNGKDAQ